MRGVLIGFTLALAATAAQAQQTWFGVPTPGPVTPIDTPTFQTAPNAYGPEPFTAYLADDARGALKAARLMADVNRIVGFSLESRAAGDPIWGRITGMPAARRTVDWTVERFKALGLKEARIEAYAFDNPLWMPKTWEVRLSTPGSPDVVLQSAVADRNASVQPKAATGPLVFVGRGTAAELANVDVRGKVAVINVVPNDSLFAAREKGVARALAKLGAVGAINAVESPGNMLYYDGRYSCDDIPCFLVGGDDGAFLESVIGKAAAAKTQVTAKLAMTAEFKPGLSGHNGVAVIPGKSPEVVIVNAHIDSWWTGADDNADGLAVMLGLADYFAHRKAPPDRTLVFMASGGHHTANGPAAFIKANPQIIARTVAVVNLEHLAQIAVGQESRLDPAQDKYASGVWTASTVESPKGAGATNSGPLMFELMAKASKKYGVVTSYKPNPSAPGDLGAYTRAGLPSAQLISSQVHYHASGDAPNTISGPGLERAAAFYATFIDDLTRAPKDRLKGPLTPQAAPPPR